MVAVVGADPGDARGLRLFDRRPGDEVHHHVAHAVVAVDQRHAGGLAFDAHVRTHVDRAALDAPDVLRQTENAVAVGAVQVGADHQLRAGGRIARGQVDGFKGGSGESLQLRGGNTARLGLGHQSCRFVKLARA